MSDHIHQRRSPTEHSDAVAREFNHPAIGLNHPDLNDPMEDQDPDSSFSNCESVVSVDQSSGLMELGEGDMLHRYIKERLLSRLGALEGQVTVAAIHRNGFSSVSAQARARTFQVHSRAVQKKGGGGGTANLRYGWYATSRDEVSKIFSYGFGYSGKPENSGLYGSGLYFAPEIHLLESLKIAPIDKDGLRHILLCRIILGKSELVSFGSEQSHPSSEKYDSGVDDLSSPTRYIIWSTHMNTHVLPEYVVSFRAPGYCLRGLLRTPEKSQKQTLPRMPSCILNSELSKILLPSDVNLISKYYKDQKGGKISRHVLAQKVGQIMRKRMLIGFIKRVIGAEVRITNPFHKQLFMRINKTGFHFDEFTAHSDASKMMHKMWGEEEEEEEAHSNRTPTQLLNL